MSHHPLQLQPDDVDRLERVLDDTSLPPLTRRRLLGHAAVAAAAASAIGPAASALAAGGDSVKTVIDTAITAEALAVTYLTAVIKQAHGSKVARFTNVLKAANAAEYDHYKALKGLGATPLTTRFWAPNDFFGPRLANVFPTLEVAETLFVNAYLIGTTAFAKAGRADEARYACEICGVEAQHRALARFAQGKLPDNVGFEAAPITSMHGIVKALERAGVGFGKKGSKPGQFVSFAPPPASALVAISGNSPS